MDIVTLSRIQFGVTTAFHFLFVPLTLGLVWFVAIFQTLYYRSGEERYRRMAKFWGKLFLVNFGMGVVTGLVQKFQFGTGSAQSLMLFAIILVFTYFQFRLGEKKVHYQ